MTYVNDHNEQNITTAYMSFTIYISIYICSHGLLKICRFFFSYALDCLQARTRHYIQLCAENLYNYEANSYIACAFFREVVQQCGNSSYIWNVWRAVTSCSECCVWMGCRRVFLWWLLMVAVGVFREAHLSGRPYLCGAGVSLSSQLLQPQPCDIQPGPRRLLCLPEKWASHVCLVAAHV